MILALLQLPLVRSLSLRRALLPLAGFLAVACVAARLARGGDHPADHVLLETVGPFVVPLLAYALARAVLVGRSLARAGAPLVSFGAREVTAGAAQIAVATVLSAALAALTTVVALLVVHAARGDVARSAAIAALAGAAYGALFTAFASFGRRGGGAIFLLAADAILGAGDGPIAALTPRGHLRSLFGGVPPADLGSRASFAVLGVMIAVAFALGGYRAARRSGQPRI